MEPATPPRARSRMTARTPLFADPDLLLPDCRTRVVALLAACHAEGIPLEVYESGRAPARQGELYAIGREPGNGELGHTRTDSIAWHSLHQWGLATDLVFRVNGQWTWVEPRPGMWVRMQALAEAGGLHILRDRYGRVIEEPHVQLGTLADLHHLQRGPNETEAWLAWLRVRAAGGAALALSADPEDRE